MKTYAAIIGLVAYNFFFAWIFHIDNNLVNPKLFRFTDSEIYVYITFALVGSFLIYVPLTKMLWNRFIVPFLGARRISFTQALQLFTLVFVIAFVLRQHNFVLFIIKYIHIS